MAQTIGQLTPTAAAVGNDQLEIEVAASVASRRIKVSDFAAAVAAYVTHGGLAGLGADDHTQYHNDVRGDVRYNTKAQITALLAGYAALAGGNTFAGDQAIEGKLIVGSTTPDIARIRPKGYVSLAVNGVATINAAAVGFLMVMNSTEGAAGLFALHPAAIELNDPSNVFSATKDTAGMANVYVESGDLKIQNKRAGTVSFHVIHFSTAGS